MKFLFLGLLLVLSSMGNSQVPDTVDAPRSLEGLILDFIVRFLNDAHGDYSSIAGVFEKIDVNDYNALTDAFSAVPCNDLCPICFEIKTDQAVAQCENHCKDVCQWDYGVDDENGELKRALIDACLGFPGGVRMSFGGIGQLLSSLPLIG